MYSLDEVKKVDPEVAQAIIDEENRQNSHIELIASRKFDTSFFGNLIQTFYLSHLWLIFLSNFMNLCVLFCAGCGIIELTWRFAYVYQYHRQ